MMKRMLTLQTQGNRPVLTTPVTLSLKYGFRKWPIYMYEGRLLPSFTLGHLVPARSNRISSWDKSMAINGPGRERGQVVGEQIHFELCSGNCEVLRVRRGDIGVQ